MPECLLFAYADQMPRLQAEQARDAAMVAVFPHMTKHSAREWLAGLSRVIARAAESVTGVTWNGSPISMDGLRRRMRQAFGGGYSEG